MLLEAAETPDSALGRALAHAVARRRRRRPFRAWCARRSASATRSTRWVDAAGGADKAMRAACRARSASSRTRRRRKSDAAIFADSICPTNRMGRDRRRCDARPKTDKDQGARFAALAALPGSERSKPISTLLHEDARKDERTLATKTIDKAASGPWPTPRRGAATASATLILRERAHRSARPHACARSPSAMRSSRASAREKDRRGLLDYDDLIDKTHDLLQRRPSPPGCITSSTAASTMS